MLIFLGILIALFVGLRVIDTKHAAERKLIKEERRKRVELLKRAYGLMRPDPRYACPDGNPHDYEDEGSIGCPIVLCQICGHRYGDE